MTKIHQVKGRDLFDALERARDTVGETAVVLSRRTAAGGVTLAVADAAPDTKNEMEQLRGRAKVLLANSQVVHSAPAPRPSTAEVEERLRLAGCSRTLVERIVEAVAGRVAEGTHPLDLAGEEIGSTFPVASQRLTQGSVSILALMGAPGAGKTTCAAKLALRLARSGRRVALVTTDTHHVGSVEQAKALGKHIGCPAIALRDPARLAKALASTTPPPEVVLMDTSGRPKEDADGLNRLAKALLLERVDAQLTRYLVMPANASKEALEQVAGEASYDGCIITQLDGTRRPAPPLEQALRKKLPVAFLCDGADLDGHLHRAGEKTFGDLLLTGRIS